VRIRSPISCSMVLLRALTLATSSPLCWRSRPCLVMVVGDDLDVIYLPVRFAARLCVRSELVFS
jgi:hypothetical protein